MTSVCGLTRLHAKGVLRHEQTKTAERDLAASIEYQVNRIQERSFNKIMKLLEEQSTSGILELMLFCISYFTRLTDKRLVMTGN